jgi:hypothetical protein
LLATLSRVLTTLLARLLLSTATLLATLSGVLTTLLATLSGVLTTLLARLLFTRVHKRSFVSPPTYNETERSKVPWVLEGKRIQPHWNLSSKMLGGQLTLLLASGRQSDFFAADNWETQVLEQLIEHVDFVLERLRHR